MKPVFALSFVVVLAAACSMQTGQKDLGNRQDPVSPVPPLQCSGLDASSCSANPACELSRSVCPGCEAAGNCANTTCFVCKDKQPPVSTCAGLDEAACNADPLCVANYEEYSCAMVMPLDGGPFEGCPKVYTGCSINVPPQDPCVGLPESMCVAPFCRPIYGAVAMAACEMAPDGGCKNLPSGYIGCEINVTSCLDNCDCNVNEYCHMEMVYPTNPDPMPGDGGVARCMAAPIPVGVCKRVPGIDPVPPSDPIDAGYTYFP